MLYVFFSSSPNFENIPFIILFNKLYNYCINKNLNKIMIIY